MQQQILVSATWRKPRSDRQVARQFGHRYAQFAEPESASWLTIEAGRLRTVDSTDSP